jgi:gamma-glutamylcyclotransferase (GGCT)/AIG2-like uncharacterized protein YtfP
MKGTNTMKNHKVFCYGILKTEGAFDDPPDSVPGTLYCQGIALARFDQANEGSLVRGEVRTVDTATLRRWDEIEGINRGFYSRIKVTTTAGVRCWAYQYERSLHGARVLADGVWRGYRSER